MASTHKEILDQTPLELLIEQLPVHGIGALLSLPFHFHHAPPPGYGEEMVGSPEVLRHFANAGYGDFDYRPKLGQVAKPTLILVGEHERTTTPRAARALHQGIAHSDLVVIPDAGQLSYVEQTDVYLDAVRRFLSAVTR